MATTTPQVLTATADQPDEHRRWVGPDDRGVELEIEAVVLGPEQLLVIHVMPTALRRRS